MQQALRFSLLYFQFCTGPGAYVHPKAFALHTSGNSAILSPTSYHSFVEANHLLKPENMKALDRLAKPRSESSKNQIAALVSLNTKPPIPLKKNKTTQFVGSIQCQQHGDMRVRVRGACRQRRLAIPFRCGAANGVRECPRACLVVGGGPAPTIACIGHHGEERSRAALCGARRYAKPPPVRPSMPPRVYHQPNEPRAIWATSSFHTDRSGFSLCRQTLLIYPR